MCPKISGLFILRVGTGAAILTHGVPKLKNFAGTTAWIKTQGIPLPVLSTAALVAAETLGAIMLILGVLVHYVGAILTFSMLIATLSHLRKNEGWKATESAAVFCIICLTLSIAGAGAWALVSA